LICLVAFAVASPIDDKKPAVAAADAAKPVASPDISKLPLKNDSSANANTKKDSYESDGVHAVPLHKRDTQKPAVPVAAVSSSVTKTSSSSSSDTVSANQKPSTSEKVLPPAVADKQPVLSSSSRVRRDAPRVADQKTASSPIPVTPTVAKANAQKSPPPPLPPVKASSTVQGSRVTRDSPKAPQVPADKPVVATKTQPAPISPAQDAKVPVTATNTRKTRDAPSQPSSVSVSSPVVAAKTPTVPLKSQPLPALPSTSSNQSPTFVHPVPVDQIIKKQPAAAVETKSDSSQKIEPALPTTDVKKTLF